MAPLRAQTAGWRPDRIVFSPGMFDTRVPQFRADLPRSFVLTNHSEAPSQKQYSAAYFEGDPTCALRKASPSCAVDSEYLDVRGFLHGVQTRAPVWDTIG
ncbi:hypothetical protein GCM10010458_32170 [Microbacterium luteolum]